jgi:hypothetical protein
MNPPDSALRGQALTQNLGPWDGLWTGSMTRYSLGGDKIAEFNVRREYSSTDPKVQTADVSRIFSDGTSESDVWVFKVTEEGQLTGNRRSEESGSAPYLGRVAGNQAFWVRHTDQGTEILRSWIHGNLLFVEEEYVPTGNPTAGWIISGQLSRTTHH